MKIIKTIEKMNQEIQQQRLSGKTVGYVPTMGYLHEGHLSLINDARKENDIVVLSIFVNPLQFGPNEDFDTYPRDFERDERLAENGGVDYIFYPSKEEMYKSQSSVRINVGDRVNVLCGKQREGHFDGVATVLIKLFNIIQPHRAYFGMKDAQQVAVVTGMIEDLNIPVELVPVETIREEDGLAKSSRNVYLSEEERKEASKLYESLLAAEQAIIKGERDPLKIKKFVESYIEKNTSAKIDYVEILSYPELKSLQRISGIFIIALAVKFTKARLIDNITLGLVY